MTEQEAIKWVRAIMATQNKSIHKVSHDDRVEALLIAIKSLENQNKIKQILSDSSLDEDDCLIKIWEIVDEK